MRSLYFEIENLRKFADREFLRMQFSYNVDNISARLIAYCDRMAAAYRREKATVRNCDRCAGVYYALRLYGDQAFVDEYELRERLGHKGSDLFTLDLMNMIAWLLAEAKTEGVEK